MSKKIIGVSIDGVLRDMHSQFDKWYRKAYIKNDSIVQMDNNFNYVPTNETEEEGNFISNRIDDLITLPIDSYDLMNHYRFESKEEYEKFLYQDYVFQIFGAANEFHRSMDYINLIQDFGQKNNLFDIVLLSTGKDKEISSTYHFLAKHVCKISNIKFVNDNQDKWNHCDILVDDCPAVFEDKPEGKISIKINHEYNSWSQCDYSFNSVVDMYNPEFLVKVAK